MEECKELPFEIEMIILVKYLLSLSYLFIIDSVPIQWTFCRYN